MSDSPSGNLQRRARLRNASNAVFGAISHAHEYNRISEGVSVMRRREDGWLNATQILKVAGFDKPQRTRVLEREVQKGVHEKVQGGYGKYQGKLAIQKHALVSEINMFNFVAIGTWVPPESALAIARQYDVEAQLRPIIDYEPSSDSPPPAPKHTVASSSLVPPSVKNNRHRSPSGYSSTRTRSARQPSVSQDSPSDTGMFSQDENTSEPSTPSPVASHTTMSPDGQDGDIPGRSARKRQRDSPESEINFPAIMLDYFMSEDPQIPDILIEPPPGLDVNVTIDEDGHTALHWAAAMGHTRVVKLLISSGADITQTNKRGQTALMRSVMFSNTYELRKFAELYECLHLTTLNIDMYNRTVLHHIADLAYSKGKLHAARYYMESALVRYVDYPEDLANVINFQDKEGETALTMAARCRSKRLVKVLLDHGADPHVKNNDGKSAEDYIIDDERIRDSPTIASRTLFRIGALDPKTQASVAAHRVGDEMYGKMAENFDELLVCLDNELKTREGDIAQANGILVELEREVQSTQKAIDDLQYKSNGALEAKKALLLQMDAENKIRIAKRSRNGMIRWIQEENDREKELWTSGRGFTKENIAKATPEALKGASFDLDVSDVAEIYSGLPQTAEESARMCNDLRDELANLVRQTDSMVETYAYSRRDDSGRLRIYQQLLAAVWPNDKGPIDMNEFGELQKVGPFLKIISLLM